MNSGVECKLSYNRVLSVFQMKHSNARTCNLNSCFTSLPFCKQQIFINTIICRHRHYFICLSTYSHVCSQWPFSSRCQTQAALQIIIILIYWQPANYCRLIISWFKGQKEQNKSHLKLPHLKVMSHNCSFQWKQNSHVGNEAKTHWKYQPKLIPL